MRLESLYPNFAKLCEAEQLAYIASYRLRRAEDMAKPATLKKRGPVKKSKVDLSLTDEEKAIMKMLGLKQKDILALRATVEMEAEEESGDLFKDSTFEDEED